MSTDDWKTRLPARTATTTRKAAHYDQLPAPTTDDRAVGERASQAPVSGKRAPPPPLPHRWTLARRRGWRRPYQDTAAARLSSAHLLRARAAPTGNLCRPVPTTQGELGTRTIVVISAGLVAVSVFLWYLSSIAVLVFRLLYFCFCNYRPMVNKHVHRKEVTTRQ